jgi:hypothetical protein
MDQRIGRTLVFQSRGYPFHTHYEPLKNDMDEKDVKEEREEVDHPSHYNQGMIEVIDFCEDQNLDLHLGTAVIYICRAEHKGTFEKDIEKAIWFLKRKLELRKGTLITRTMRNFANTQKGETS